MAICPDKLDRDSARQIVRELMQENAQLKAGTDLRVQELQAQLAGEQARSAGLEQRCCDLEAALGAERKALQAEKQRYQELDAKHQSLLRSIYTRKNEKLSEAQRAQIGLTQTAPVAAAPAAGIPAAVASASEANDSARQRRKKRKQARHTGGGRRPKPANLPIRVQVLDVPEEERVGLKLMRYEVSDRFGYEPARFFIERTLRPVWGDPQRTRPPMVAPLPAQVIPQAGVSVSFIVHVLIAKYQWAIPLYRQAQMDERCGVEVDRGARCRYVEAAAHLLLTIWFQLKELILRNPYISIDEAFTKVLDPERPGKARDAFMWGFLSPHAEAMVMEFSTSRSASHISEFIPKGWKGTVGSDGAAMYPSALEKRAGVVHVECMAHLRRYVFAAFMAGDLEAGPLLKDIAELYAIEDRAGKLRLTQAQRGAYRHRHARPVLKRLQRRFLELKNREQPLLGKLRQAVIYATNRWRQLQTYAARKNGHIEIDQNGIERNWRPQKVGLRNFLFIGHPEAGWRSAVLYSIIATCRLVGVDAEEYLTWVLPKLAAATTKTATSLLPHDFKKLKQAQEAATARRRACPHCSGRPPSGHRRYRRSHRFRNESTLAA